MIIGCCLLWSCLVSACRGRTVHADRVVVIQPLGEFSLVQATKISQQLKTLHAKVLVRPAIPLSARAYYAPRNRYRADTLIQWLSGFGNSDTVIIGFTNKDVSVTKGNIRDWGVMGFGFCPGYACVASSFRLAKSNREEQFYKVAVHELGHTQGLPHCDEHSCLMRDAEGGNPLNEEKDFCPPCKAFLKSKGWRL